MLWQPALPDRYYAMSDEDLAQAIAARREQLGDILLILGHHYQQDDVIQHADLTGDSLKLSRLAAEEASKRGTKYIVFCGVHFMAETADLLTDDAVAVILPDLSAGCPMADMADYDDVVEAWESIHAVLGNDQVIPIAYVNSSAAVKAFVGEHGGACCTSANAAGIFEWALAGGERPAQHNEELKVLFLPDQHLGRNTVSKFGLLTELDEAAGRGRSQTAVWNPKLDCGGLSEQQIRDSKILLWDGHCTVHMRFHSEHVQDVRHKYADKGGVTVIVHPECRKEVVDAADDCGSTEYIVGRMARAEVATNWAIGTEAHLVQRLARSARRRQVNVEMLGGHPCMCSMMYRINPQHLLWALDNLAEGTIVNRIEVPPGIRKLARLALQRMIPAQAATAEP